MAYPGNGKGQKSTTKHSVKNQAQTFNTNRPFKIPYCAAIIPAKAGIMVRQITVRIRGLNHRFQIAAKMSSRQVNNLLAGFRGSPGSMRRNNQIGKILIQQRVAISGRLLG